MSLQWQPGHLHPGNEPPQWHPRESRKKIMQLVRELEKEAVHYAAQNTAEGFDRAASRADRMTILLDGLARNLSSKRMIVSARMATIVSTRIAARVEDFRDLASALRKR